MPKCGPQNTRSTDPEVVAWGSVRRTRDDAGRTRRPPSSFFTIRERRAPNVGCCGTRSLVRPGGVEVRRDGKGDVPEPHAGRTCSAAGRFGAANPLVAGE